MFGIRLAMKRLMYSCVIFTNFAWSFIVC